MSSPLLARWPEVARALEGVGGIARLAGDRGPHPTLVAEGIQLASAYDRRAEALLQAERIPRGSRTAWVYGLALGDLPRVLLERPELERLNLVVLSPDLAADSLRLLDHGDWLSDPRVDLSLARNQRLRRPFAVAPACLRFAEVAAAPLRDSILLELVRPYQARRHAEREAMLATSVEQNLARLDEDGDVRAVFGTAAGGRVAVVAGGPTASEGIGILRRRDPAVPVVAVSTALTPLLRAGVRPDLMVAVDPKPELLAHFDDADPALLGDVPLVYAPIVHPSVLQRWPGPRFAALLDPPRYDHLTRGRDLGRLFCRGTVTHAAVDLAVKMGAAEVLLIGADFCYAHGRSHVEGAAQAFDPTTARLAGTWVVDGRGRRVPSDVGLVGYLRDLEAFVAAHPHVRFLKVGRDGARIQGVELAEDP